MNTKPTHTPGPWKNQGTLVYQGETSAGVARIVADARGRELENARLIAAAPEMLEALEYLVRMIDESPLYLDAEQEMMRNKAHETLKKARGES